MLLRLKRLAKLRYAVPEWLFALPVLQAVVAMVMVVMLGLLNASNGFQWLSH